MNANKILALLLTLALLLGLAACGGQGDESSASKESTGSAVDEPSSSSQSSLDSSEASTPEEDNGSVHPLRIVQAGTLPSAYEEGIAATNQKLKEDGLNIEVSVQRIPWDTYNEKMNLIAGVAVAIDHKIVNHEIAQHPIHIQHIFQILILGEGFQGTDQPLFVPIRND